MDDLTTRPKAGTVNKAAECSRSMFAFRVRGPRLRRRTIYRPRGYNLSWRSIFSRNFSAVCA